jgi:hypothetical protein
MLHCCYTLVTIFLHCCHTLVQLLFRSCYTVVTLLSHLYYTVVLHSCHTIITQGLERETADRLLHRLKKMLYVSFEASASNPRWAVVAGKVCLSPAMRFLLTLP